MKTRRLLLATLSCAAMFVGASAFGVAPSDDASHAAFAVVLGQTSLTLPVPAGFGAPTRSPHQVVDLIARNLPEQNHMIAIMMSGEDLDRVARKVHPTMSRYFSVMTVRAYETNAATPADFDQLKNLLRRQGNELMKRMQKRYESNIEGMGRDAGKMSGDPAASLKIQVGDALGVFDEHPNSIAVANLSTVALGSRNGVEQIPIVMASGFVLVRGVPVNFNAYAEFHSKADVEWAETEVRDWIRQTNELNLRSPRP